jgi:hypothetical protein
LTLDVALMNLVAKLVPPHMDKSFSFQAHGLTPEQRHLVLRALFLPEVVQAKPFRQGDTGSWLMIEFWTKDREVIQAAAEGLARAIGVHDLQEGNFTRKEIGLE